MFLKSKLQFLAKKVKLESHRTFIIPTGFGIAFGGISFVLLVMAIGYANNLLYFFVFLLISMALTGMWLTNKNVDSVQITDISAPLLFAKEDNSIDLHLHNKNHKSFSWDIEISFKDKSEKYEKVIVEEVQFDNKCAFNWIPPQRGLHRFPRLRLESRFPYKMLNAWKYYDQKNEFVVYPQRRGIERIPQVQGKKSDHEITAEVYEQGLFRDFREFQKSDSPRRIDWKRSLKHQKHLVKNYESSGEKKVILTWEMTSFQTDFEARVSQLAYWIEMCHQKQELYTLRIKNETSAFSSSASHYKECMHRLALLQLIDVSA